MSFDASLRHEADEAFSLAHGRAFLQRALAVLRRQPPASLLSFDMVRDKLKIRGQHSAGTQLVPLDTIVGTVGRYREFDRAFLPREEHIRERWKTIYEATQTHGLPPVDLYKVGDVYFVRDGHHRVSVLKELGATFVEATVTEFDTPVPLSPDVREGDLNLKEEYAIWLLETDLATLRPEQRIEFTLPGQYRKLLEHIAVHRYFLGMQEQREIPYAEAVARWYDEVYMPLVRVIRETRVLEQFPDRTEADLYLWLIEHRHYLSQEHGRSVPYQDAAADFRRAFARGAGKKRLQASVKGVRFGHQAGTGENEPD